MILNGIEIKDIETLETLLFEIDISDNEKEQIREIFANENNDLSINQN